MPTLDCVPLRFVFDSRKSYYKDNSIPGCCDHLSHLDSLQDPTCYFQSVYLDSSLEVCSNLEDNQLTTAIIKCYLSDQNQSW